MHHFVVCVQRWSSTLGSQAPTLRLSSRDTGINLFVRFIEQDAFVGVGDDDATMLKLNENENELKELRTFTDLIHSKNKVILSSAYLRIPVNITQWTLGSAFGTALYQIVLHICKSATVPLCDTFTR